MLAYLRSSIHSFREISWNRKNIIRLIAALLLLPAILQMSAKATLLILATAAAHEVLDAISPFLRIIHAACTAIYAVLKIVYSAVSSASSFLYSPAYSALNIAYSAIADFLGDLRSRLDSREKLNERYDQLNSTHIKIATTLSENKKVLTEIENAVPALDKEIEAVKTKQAETFRLCDQAQATLSEVSTILDQNKVIRHQTVEACHQFKITAEHVVNQQKIIDAERKEFRELYKDTLSIALNALSYKSRPEKQDASNQTEKDISRSNVTHSFSASAG